MESKLPVTLAIRHLIVFTKKRFSNNRHRALLRIYFSISSCKSYILFSVNAAVSVNINNNALTFENKNELLGIVLNSKLSFEDHINSLCKKTS